MFINLASEEQEIWLQF